MDVSHNWPNNCESSFYPLHRFSLQSLTILSIDLDPNYHDLRVSSTEHYYHCEIHCHYECILQRKLTYILR
jgi:hypothetical protein